MTASFDDIGQPLRHTPVPQHKPRTLSEQFGNPTGWIGALVGHLMALKNAERNKWILSLVRPQSRDFVLEIGFGPGQDIARVLEVVKQGVVAGVDHSEVMLRQATRRNRTGVSWGNAKLRLGSACSLPYGDGTFDRVYSINSVQFWEDLGLAIREMKRVLRAGGLAAIAIQPRGRHATAETTREWSARLRNAFMDAGFHDVKVRVRAVNPVPTTCVLATRP